jgi:hypothetical protein
LYKDNINTLESAPGYSFSHFLGGLDREARPRKQVRCRLLISDKGTMC